MLESCHKHQPNRQKEETETPLPRDMDHHTRISRCLTTSSGVGREEFSRARPYSQQDSTTYLGMYCTRDVLRNLSVCSQCPGCQVHAERRRNSVETMGMLSMHCRILSSGRLSVRMDLSLFSPFFPSALLGVLIVFPGVGQHAHARCQANAQQSSADLNPPPERPTKARRAEQPSGIRQEWPLLPR